MLLIGIQGTGKSLTAKAVATEWQLPLLKLDVGKLFGGIVGESESRLRQTIALAETLSPCILWIDEIDKAFTVNDSSETRPYYILILSLLKLKPEQLIYSIIRITFIHLLTSKNKGASQPKNMIKAKSIPQSKKRNNWRLWTKSNEPRRHLSLGDITNTL